VSQVRSDQNERARRERNNELQKHKTQKEREEINERKDKNGTDQKVRRRKQMIIRSLVFFLAFGESKRCDRGYEKINGRCVDRNECTEEQDLFSFDSGLIFFN